MSAQGTRFENFHVASPVCMPNRASLLTGRYPSVHGLRYNGCRLPLRANTFVDLLSQAGYHTAALGKSHIQPFTGMPPVGRTQAEMAGKTEAWKADDGIYDNEEPGNYKDEGRYEFDTPYYGHNYSCPQAYRTPIPEALYPTAYVRNSAVNYIKSRVDKKDPFFAFVSFPDPHHPFNPPGKYWDLYSPDDFDVSTQKPNRANAMDAQQLEERRGAINTTNSTDA